jgi:hypothetical protein
LEIRRVGCPVNENPSHAFDDKLSRDRVRSFAGSERTDFGIDGEKLGLGLDRSWKDIAEETDSSWPIGWPHWPMSQALRVIVGSDLGVAGVVNIRSSFSEWIPGWQHGIDGEGA